MMKTFTVSADPNYVSEREKKVDGRMRAMEIRLSGNR